MNGEIDLTNTTTADQWFEELEKSNKIEVLKTNIESKAIKNLPDFPVHLDIEITGRCNLMCLQCFRFSRRTDIGDMKFSLFEKVINESIKYKKPSINLSWLGEPFLHSQVIKMMKFANQRGIENIWLYTNGILVDEKMAYEVLESGLKYIVFSIDAVSKEEYSNTKIGSDLDLVRKNIENLITFKKKINPSLNVFIQILYNNQNEQEIKTFINDWQDKVDMIRITLLQKPDGSYSMSSRKYEIFPCSQLWERLVIAWDGTVYACTGDNACRTPLENIKNIDLYRIWHSDLLNMLRQQHLNFEANKLEACQFCDFNKVNRKII